MVEIKDETGDNGRKIDETKQVIESQENKINDEPLRRSTRIR